MTSRRTRDGLKLSKIIRAVQSIESLSIRDGTNHPYILNYENLIPCPVAESSNAKTMIVPWLKQATGFANGIIYQALQRGYW